MGNRKKFPPEGIKEMKEEEEEEEKAVAVAAGGDCEKLLNLKIYPKKKKEIFILFYFSGMRSKLKWIPRSNGKASR